MTPNKYALLLLFDLSAPSVTNVQLAVEHIYPLVSNYRMEKKSGQRVEMVNSKMHLMPANRSRPGPGRFRKQPRVRCIITCIITSLSSKNINLFRTSVPLTCVERGHFGT